MPLVERQGLTNRLRQGAALEREDSMTMGAHTRLTCLDTATEMALPVATCEHQVLQQG